MDDVRGDFLGPPHGTTPAAVIENWSYFYGRENQLRWSKLVNWRIPTRKLGMWILLI